MSAYHAVRFCAPTVRFLPHGVELTSSEMDLQMRCIGWGIKRVLLAYRGITHVEQVEDTGSVVGYHASIRCGDVGAEVDFTPDTPRGSGVEEWARAKSEASARSREFYAELMRRMAEAVAK